nr:immunoglobulin light chain junction region [Macaca mulatta]MOW18048.1 immunoglobulin light chain junction region [Macaca mulatta]MOW18620.1 immunoglobulin light chain junction region [Macaca mulatta]
DYYCQVWSMRSDHPSF